jgi:hypothetical protein
MAAKIPAKVIKKYAQPEPTKWGRILGAVGFGALAIAVPFLQAGSAIDNAIVYTFGLGQTYDVRGPRPSFSGFTAKDIALKFDDGEVRIKQVDVNIGFWGMLKNAYSQRMNAPVDRVSFVYSGIQNPEGYSLFDQLGLIGPESASVFEAQGCGEHSYWSGDELQAVMKLPVRPATMTVDFENVGERVVRTTTFDTPGASSATFSYTAIGMPTERTMFAIPFPGEFRGIKLSLKDAGFIKARNAFCAKFTSVSEAQFIDNHMASIRRKLLANGIEASAQMLSVYQEFAAKGGELKLDLTLRSTHTGRADSFGDVFAALQGEISVGNKREAYFVLPTRAADYPDGMEDNTAYEVLIAEKSLPSQTQGAVAVDAQAAANVDSETRASETEVVQAQVTPGLTSRVVTVESLDREYLTSFSAVLANTGRRMRIERIGKAPIIAQVLRDSKNGVWLKVRQAGGFAEVELQRAEFKRALLYANR